METKDILRELRTKRNLSQDELAEIVFVTRQAVSRWETGETLPGTDTLKLLSKVFDVSINTLLGSPRKLVCQCCGMPLTDDLISKDKDEAFNENYCKWCYYDGEFTYNNMDDLIKVCIPHMVASGFNENEAREYMKSILPKLNYWKNKEDTDGAKNEELKKTLIKEFNALNIKGLPKVTALNALVGIYVNLEYPLPNGTSAKFLKDDVTYFGNQVEIQDGDKKCYGIVGCRDFILVARYGEGGSDPELIAYKKL
ncbi:MAG: helix-turn-helix domain-containing protein [Clostridia bacterium]|nr:helix-turn-helix domain-containing protein [Clostridia bacterium]